MRHEPLLRAKGKAQSWLIQLDCHSWHWQEEISLFYWATASITEALQTTIYRKLWQIPSAEADTEPASNFTLCQKSRDIRHLLTNSNSLEALIHLNLQMLLRWFISFGSIRDIYGSSRQYFTNSNNATCPFRQIIAFVQRIQGGD